jgi:hypothetical protein
LFPTAGGFFGAIFTRRDRRSLRLGDPGTPVINALARELIRTTSFSTGNRRVPAGYTYLGQFIDHDITFDPTSKLDRDTDPTTLRNFRTPRLDLDSLYGTGPLDQPFLYDWDEESVGGVKPLRGAKLLVGSSRRAGRTVDDLPRNEQNRALIGDPRNDENIIVSQLHLLFIHFHNRIVDRVVAGDPGASRDDAFDEAQQLVRWHYQWVAMNDFLPRIVGEKMAHSVLTPGAPGTAPTVHLKFFKFEKQKPYMPVEFSGAAYRFGHSMVRDNYVLNDRADAVSVFAPGRRRKPETLIGRRRLPPELAIEWKHFFDTTPTIPNRSMRIDPFLSPALRHVPPKGRPLAQLNLDRGVFLKLPAGLAVAERMDEPRLTDDQLIAPLPRFAEDGAIRRALLDATPLWYYVLCEASSAAGLNGLRLGPVGGRIVAEVLVGLLEGDNSSYLNAKQPWQPELPKAGDDFTMADLVRYAQGETDL